MSASPDANMDDESAQESERKMIDDITAICNSLGKLDENDGHYMKARDCRASLKDLQRYLMSDTKQHLVRSMLGNMNIIKCDFIPLIIQYCDYEDGDLEMFTIIMRLCTNLTSSVLLLFENEEIPTDPEERKIYDKLLQNLCRFKEAFAGHEHIWLALKDHLLHNKGDDEITFERIIILTRNILQAPVDSTSDMGMHEEHDTHSQLLLCMEKAGFLNTLIHLMAESEAGAKYCFHLMEIMYFMLRDQNPETIAMAKSINQRKRPSREEDPEKKRFAELSARNKRQRELESKFQPARFKNVSYTVTNIKGIGSDNLIVHRPTGDVLNANNFGADKTKLRKLKFNKSGAVETSVVISDNNVKTSKVTYHLHLFCKQFVQKVYNAYMTQIKHNLIQKKAQDNDESYYLWGIQFFSAFNRKLGLELDNIAETVSTSCLHFIQVIINTYQDKIEVEKKRFQNISKRLHLALRAYREILIVIQSVDRESPFAEKVKAIKKAIFNDLEYSTLVINLFQKFSEQKHSPHFLKDLIITNHVFLQLITGDVNKRTETMHFLSRYCCLDVIKCYIAALQNHKSLSKPMCCIILAFLKHVVEDCQRGVMLFQVSLFALLMDIHDHGTTDCRQGYVDLYVKLIQEFGRLFNKRRWVFQEALFWKSASDIIDIEMAIEPPAEQPRSPANRPQSPTLEEAIQTTTSQLPTETLEELMAELEDSDDDSDDSEKNHNQHDDNEPSSAPQVDGDGRDTDSANIVTFDDAEIISENQATGEAVTVDNDDDMASNSSISSSSSSNSSLPSVGSSSISPDNEASSGSNEAAKVADDINPPDEASGPSPVDETSNTGCG